MQHRMLAIAGLALLTGTAPAATPAPGPAYAVFLRLADAPVGQFQTMVEAVPALATRAGMTLLATLPSGTGGCRFHATVFVLAQPAWSDLLQARGPAAAFAAPLRLAVVEDEAGTHLVVVNPQSLARTIVAEDFDAPAGALVESLEAAVRAGFPGTPVHQPYGQVRDRGLIGKTMGIVAGGPFPEKVEGVGRVKVTATRGVTTVADAIAEAGATPTRRWGLRLAYRQPLPGGQAELLGFSGEAMEAKSFSIVGSGGDEARRAYACPGLDHAPAYPLEVLVTREDDEVRVLITDVMFRMKMYFEDAGTMKFAANMAMPGSIEDELRDRVEQALDDLHDRAALR